MIEAQWLVLTVQAPSDALKPTLAEGLLALGGSAVHEEGDALTTYVRPPEDVMLWVENAVRKLRAAGDVPALNVTYRWQPDEDWSQSWKKGLKPRRIGRHFVVAPSWTSADIASDDHLIIVDPEMAFGTGEHATTRSALRLLEEAVRPGNRVLDMGTGSAILAIAAVQLGAAEVVAPDNDPDAILNARGNVARNGVAGSIRLEQRCVDAAYLREVGEEAFDVIVANVLSGVLQPLLASLLRAVARGGHVILGGMLEAEAEDMLDRCTAAGFEIMAEDLEQEWWAVLLRRPPAAAR